MCNYNIYAFSFSSRIEAMHYQHMLLITECCLAMNSISESSTHYCYCLPLTPSHSFLLSPTRLLSESKVFIGLGFPYDGQYSIHTSYEYTMFVCISLYVYIIIVYILYIPCLYVSLSMYTSMTV